MLWYAFSAGAGCGMVSGIEVVVSAKEYRGVPQKLMANCSGALRSCAVNGAVEASLDNEATTAKTLSQEIHSTTTHIHGLSNSWELLTKVTGMYCSNQERYAPIKNPTRAEPMLRHGFR